MSDPDVNDINRDPGCAAGETSSDVNISFGDFIPEEFRFRVDTQKHRCICVSILTPGNGLSILADYIQIDPTILMDECFCNMLIKIFNFFLAECPNFDDPARLNFIDMFFRLRHELLFKYFLLSFNLPLVKSDIPFSSYGIDSNRTPDYIHEASGVLHIFEITATSNLERAAVTKGLEEAGFEAKYYKEIEMLQAAGRLVQYHVLIFDMGNINNEDFLNKFDEINFLNLNEHFLGKLKYYRRNLANITQNYKSYINASAAVLFSNILSVEPDHADLEFLYTHEAFDYNSHYAEFIVSEPVYSKISNVWFRIPNILANDRYFDNKKYTPILDAQNHRLEFNVNHNGLYPSQICDLVTSNNKIDFFKILKLRLGNHVTDAIGSETGVVFIDKIKGSKGVDAVAAVMDVKEGHNSNPYHIEQAVDLKFYEIAQVFNRNLYKSKTFDENYEDDIINMIDAIDIDIQTDGDFRSLSGQKLFGLSRTDDIIITEVMTNFENEMILINSPNNSIPLKTIKMKSPFILPLASLTQDNRCNLHYKNYTFLNDIISSIENTDKYTTIILKNALSENFIFHDDKPQPSSVYMKLKVERYEVSSKLTKEYKLLFKQLKCKTHDDFVNMTKNEPSEFINYNILRSEVAKINKDLNNRAKFEGVKEKIGFIRLPTKKRGILNNYYRLEQEHFKDKNKQSTTEGYGVGNGVDQCIDSVGQFFEECSDTFAVNCGDNDDFLIDLETYDDALLLKELKTKAIIDHKNLIQQVKNSFIGHAAAFVSRLAHSLLFYSQLAFNSDYVRVDNLGYKDVLLLVKGGKKIFKSKSSKMYRLLYPVTHSIMFMYQEPGITPSSTKFITTNSGLYCLTPWALMHEDILNDSLSFYPRVCSFITLNSNPAIDYHMQVKKTLFNVLLGFHNRRQTEVFLANMRYILLSTMGDYTGISDIFKDFVGFNYDKFQCYIRMCIARNYADYFKKMSIIRKEIKQNETLIAKNKFRHLFTSELINDTDELALMIYSTFLMTKGPYQKAVERSTNLKGILKVHEQYDASVGVNLNPEQQLNKIKVNVKDSYGGYNDNYVRELMSNDFFIDDKYCANLGHFANDYMKAHVKIDDLNTEWLHILNQPWDSMATSTGLRGDLTDQENFWGKKGYFIIYKQLLRDEKFVESLEAILNTDLDDDAKRRKLRKLNSVFLDKIVEPPTLLVFHAVDKKQWRGGREIYVMDINTKQMQQPIEKYMAYLCKQVDNEIISIPSDKRAQLIHHSIFEKDLPLKDIMTWYLTLDCTKWAPKSVFIKFAIMILSMPVLPNTFKTHFLNYLDKLYKKRIYFNESEVNVLLNNPTYAEACKKYLIRDDYLNGYYLLMPYSWVMGIFNYTSSFMHAFNQKYASYLINKTSIKNWGEETDLRMLAHSDDSGGRISAANDLLIQRGLILYEINLKCCNHLLSYKKSVVAKFYFEILSVIYMFKKLMALLPKFLGGIRFTPTDKGPTADMSQSYSKCIEIIIAGADFSTAYIYMKFYSALVWRFYHNKKPIKTDYYRPTQYLGMPDAHPLMVLLIGSDSDFVRLIYTGNENLLIILTTFINALTTGEAETDSIPTLAFKINIKNINNDFEAGLDKFKEVLKSWSVKNVNFKTTPFNLLNFLAKLNNKGFIGALTNESATRRISRSYFIRSGNSVLTTVGEMLLSDVVTELRVLQTLYLDNQLGAETALTKILLRNEILTDMTNVDSQLNQRSKNQVNTIKLINQSQLKLYNYLNVISLADKPLREVSRTLKPTHLQIIKMGKTFSSPFDPAQLVSYIKEPEFRWALPGYRNLLHSQKELERMCENYCIDLSQITPDQLLKLIRIHQNKNVKDIYLYSQIGSDLRVIKTYAAILQFLSSNSLKGLEIKGLTLKLKSTLTDPGYNITELDESVYFTNTMINICITLLKNETADFVAGLNIKTIDELYWQGGSFLDFIDHMYKTMYYEKSYNSLNLQMLYCKSKLEGNDIIYSSFLKECTFYTFLKEQKNKAGWYGKGEILFYCDKVIYSFEIMNDRLTLLRTNKIGAVPQPDLAFMTDVLSSLGLNIYNSMKDRTTEMADLYFGQDLQGDICIGKRNIVNHGIKCLFLESLPSFIVNLDNYSIKHIKENLFIVEDTNNNYSHKVYALPMNKGDMLKIINKCFNAVDFKDRIIIKGYDNFSQFLATEVMFDYGEVPIISNKEFFDCFTGSKIYKLFLDDQENGSNVRLMVNSEPKNYPAAEGTIVRLVYDYDQRNQTTMISIPKNINADMLAVRAEYPEQFSVILAEKLRESYDNLFNSDEQDEIRDSYVRLINIHDPVTLRQQLIKLMSHWGHESLVQTVERYNFDNSDVAFKTIQVSNVDNRTNIIFSGFFPLLLNAINKAFLINSGLFNPIDIDNKLCSFNDVRGLIFDNLISVCNNCYGFELVFNCLDITHLIFVNYLHTFLKYDEFCATLKNEIKAVPILNTVKINYQNRYIITAVYNTLATIWSKMNKTKFEPDYTKKLIRFPDDAPGLRTLLNKFNMHGIPLAQTNYYNGFLNQFIMDNVINNTDLRIKTKNSVFRIKCNIADVSDNVAVPAVKELELRTMLTDEAAEHDNMEEMLYEYFMEDIDLDAITELWEGIEEPKFIKSKIKVTSKGSNSFVDMTVNWIIIPYRTGKSSLSSKIRQVGEVFIILTNMIVPEYSNFPNTTVRLINYSNLASEPCRDMIAYCHAPPHVSQEFFESYVGGHIVHIDTLKELSETLHAEYIITRNQICPINKVGIKITTEDEMAEQTKKTIKKKWSDEAEASEKEIGVAAAKENVRRIKEQGHKIEDIIDVETANEFQKQMAENFLAKEQAKIQLGVYLEDHLKNGIIDEVIAERLSKKYKAELSAKFKVDVETVLSSMKNEFHLISLLSSVKDKDFKLSPIEFKRVFLSPVHFGLAHGYSNPKTRPVKDGLLYAELESLSTGLADKLISNCLFIDDRTLKLIKAQQKMHKRDILASRLKIDNKKFFYTLMEGIINNAVLVNKHSKLEECDKDIWQELMNNYILLFGEDGDDDSSTDEETPYILSHLAASTLKYRLPGL